MRKVFHVFLLVFFSITGVSGAAVLTFEDVSQAGFWEYIPDGYGGFEWEHAGRIDKDIKNGSGSNRLMMRKKLSPPLGAGNFRIN